MYTFYICKIKPLLETGLNRVRQTMEDERGIGVVEVILILVVVIGLVIIFKSQLTSLVNTIFQKITSESATI